MAAASTVLRHPGRHRPPFAADPGLDVRGEEQGMAALGKSASNATRVRVDGCSNSIARVRPVIGWQVPLAATQHRLELDAAGDHLLVVARSKSSIAEMAQA
ncbi:MAG: hypothetical protein U5R48_19915 [Gammaproteobacteria bacterium]|nr:hypothetical protein [Gammaproteobacteria bacterium]